MICLGLTVTPVAWVCNRKHSRRGRHTVFSAPDFVGRPETRPVLPPFVALPLKTPAAFHERIRSLERARTGNFLKHKLCSRPQRAELVRLHILQETQAEPSLQATQMKLKRARLADDLNEKIAQRPGPMELVEKNILPVDSQSDQKASAPQPSATVVPCVTLGSLLLKVRFEAALHFTKVCLHLLSCSF
uniref:Phosphatase and actin regulator n=1 Tax=Mola mola TaxID=94237 RepID=A0A3Q3X2Y5_MOLML